MTDFSCSIDTLGNGQVTVYGDSPYVIRTVTVFPEGFSYQALTESNVREMLSWPEDGDVALKAVTQCLRSFEKDYEKPLLSAAAKALQEQIKRKEDKNGRIL